MIAFIMLNVYVCTLPSGERLLLSTLDVYGAELLQVVSM